MLQAAAAAVNLGPSGGSCGVLLLKLCFSIPIPGSGFVLLCQGLYWEQDLCQGREGSPEFLLSARSQSRFSSLSAAERGGRC